MSDKNFDIKLIKNIISEEINKFDSQEYVSNQEGRVISVGDGIATISGLSNVMLNEIVVFETGVSGIVLNLEKDNIGVVMLGKFDDIKEDSIVHSTGKVFSVPVGFNFIGRVVDANVNPIDGKGPIVADGYAPVEKIAPGVMKRQSVDQPLETGILSIDAMFPIGKGQRELIIGDRQTGKTTVATDAIINQKGKDVYCIYVAIGQKNSTIAALVKNLEEQGAMEYTTVVSASASDLPALQYIAPYTGVTLAEYLMSKGKDVLIVYDDLSKHAVAYRTLSLLLRRPPGREAFPGDVFYLHSRLLERACRLNKENGGGSITALPIIETLAGDISAYIPTNVISITDGQIFMMSSLFNSGQRPAIDAGLSVSRVGGAAQIKSVKSVSGSLKLELANYRELDAFSQFGSDLDPETKSIIHHGKRCMLMLRQLPNQPLSQTDEAILMLAIKQKYIDAIPENRIQEYKKFIITHVDRVLWKRLYDAKEFTKNELDPIFKVHLYDLTLKFLGLCDEYDLEEKREWAAFLNRIIGDLKTRYQVSGKKDVNDSNKSRPVLNQVPKKIEKNEDLLDELIENSQEIIKEVEDEGNQEEIAIDKELKKTLKESNELEKEINSFQKPHNQNNSFPKTTNSIIRKKLIEDDRSKLKTNISENIEPKLLDYFFYNFTDKPKPPVWIYQENEKFEPITFKPIADNPEKDFLQQKLKSFNINSNYVKQEFEQEKEESKKEISNQEESIIRQKLIEDDKSKSKTIINDNSEPDLLDYYHYNFDDKPNSPVQVEQKEEQKNISFNVNETWSKNVISDEEIEKRETQTFKAVTSKEIEKNDINSPSTIMISLSKDEVANIIEEGKSVLFFKLLPVQEVKRVIIYVTKDKALNWNGGVIGEFDLAKKIKMSKSSAWTQYGSMSTLRKKDFDEYYRTNRTVSIMEISGFFQYRKPKKIEDYGISKSPSSFTYLK